MDNHNSESETEMDEDDSYPPNAEVVDAVDVDILAKAGLVVFRAAAEK